MSGLRRALVASCALLGAAGCGSPGDPPRPPASAARTAVEDRDALRALADGFHREDFAEDTWCVRFSPSGKLVAVVTPTAPLRRGGEEFQTDYTLRVWPCRDGRVVHASGDAPLLEKRGRRALDPAPRWSHEGDRLAFTVCQVTDRMKPPVDAYAHLHVWSQETGIREIGVLHEPKIDIVVSSPCWSPNDHFVALAEGWFTPVELHLFDVDGGVVVTKRIDDDANDGHPRASWSPEGRWIAVQTRRRVFVHDLDSGETRRLFELPQPTYLDAWTPPQWDDGGAHLGVILGSALTIDLPDGTVHEWKSAESVVALTWIPGGSHWFAITDREGPENGFARAFRVLTRDCSEPPHTTSGCVADGDGRVVETAFTTNGARTTSMIMAADERCWFMLPWAETVLLRTIR